MRVWIDHWYVDHVFVLAPAATYVAKWLQSFREFPQRQKPGSFNLDRIMNQLPAALLKMEATDAIEAWLLMKAHKTAPVLFGWEKGRRSPNPHTAGILEKFLSEHPTVERPKK